MTHCKRWIVWILLLWLATLLRLPASDWDGGIAAHPDERFLLGVGQTTPLGGNPCAASTDFPYGHLPVTLVSFLTVLAPARDPLIPARLLSGLVGVLLVVMAGGWGKKLVGNRAGLLAAALMAWAPFPIQQARFYTVDPLAAVLASAAVLSASRRRWIAAGSLAGLALACKASLIWLGAPLLFAALVAGTSDLTFRNLILKGDLWRTVISRRTIRMALSALVAFALVSPWALLRPISCWRGPWIQAGMAAGRYVFPYTQQYAGTLPYVYPFVQLSLWGLGPIVAVMALIGLIEGMRHWQTLSNGACVALVWTLVYFLAMSALYAKFPRYLLPLYPLWAGWGAWFCEKGCRWGYGRARAPRVFALFAFLALVFTIPLGLAQLLLYAETHPWISASRWLYTNLLPGETVAVELWDHPLPIPLPEGNSDAYQYLTVPIFDADSLEKSAQLAAASSDADVIVLASRRGYGGLAHQPERYAETLDWYREVIVDREVLAFGRCPRLGPLALTDDPIADAGLPVPVSLAARCGTPYALRLPRLDESFRVYDAPTVLLLLKRR